MKQDTTSKDNIQNFVDKLVSLGYTVSEISKKPQVYSINGKSVNIRSRGKSVQLADGSRVFWYSIAFSVIPIVDFVIYLMTSPDYFIMVPSQFLGNLKEYMYPDYSKNGVGIFTINWDSLEIQLKHGQVKSLDNYYHNLICRDDYPIF